MNREIEQTARPYLTPLITGDPVTLNPEHMKLVADWIALKCMVAEHASVNTSVTPRRDRIAFKEKREIPPYYRIYIANHNCGTGTGFNRHSVCMGINSPTISPPLEGTSNNIQTITFLLGRVVIHLNAARVDDFTLESRIIVPLIWGFCRLWPDSEITDPNWPRRPLLSRQGIGILNNLLTGYISAGSVTWLDGSL